MPNEVPVDGMLGLYVFVTRDLEWRVGKYVQTIAAADLAKARLVNGRIVLESRGG